MGRTPDPIGDGVELPEVGVDPSVVGGLTLNSGVIKARDATGVFNVRTGGSGLTAEQHEVLRQLIHFIDNGPTSGFASGAYRENVGGVFPTSITWWTSAAKTHKIVEKLLTYTGAFPTTIQWKMYDTDGSTVLATVTDTITYSGAYETSRTRTIT